MGIFEWKTVTVGLSLLCLPVLLTIFVMALPVVMFVTTALYIIAWLIYFQLAQSNARFHLPYHPSRILKINYVAASHFALAVSLIPHGITHLVWRYWKTGPSGAREGVHRNIPYSKDGHKDHTYDLYLPVSVQTNAGSLARVPIVVFIYGGSWSSGNKAFYGLLANMLRRMGYIAVVPDYRKYPEVLIEDIYDDVRQVLEVVGQEGDSWGGDVDRIFVIGHSAGAHITAQVVLGAVLKEVRMRAASEVGAAVATAGMTNGKVNAIHSNGFGHGPKMPNVQGLVLMAGVYDVAAHYDFEAARGVEDISAMGRCMGGSRKSFDANSPKYLLPLPRNAKSAKALEGAERGGEYEMLAAATSRCLAEIMPRVMLVHGERDGTVPVSSTIDFYKAIGNAIREEDRDTVDVRVRLYKRMGHSEVVTALMANLFFRNRSTGSLIRDLKEFIEPEMFENSDDDF